MKNKHEADVVDPAAKGNAQTEGMTNPEASEKDPDARVRRIMDYLQSALDKQDALQANLSAANADLMMIGYKLATAIKAAMATAPASLEAYEELVPAIGNLLRIHKQVDRFSALDSRLASANASAASLKARATAAIEQSEDLEN
jgi:hypothetical protein